MPKKLQRKLQILKNTIPKNTSFKIKFFSTFLLACLLYSNFALAQSWDTQEIFKPLINDVKRFELSNGLKVVFYQRKNSPVFSGQLWVKVGGVNERIGQTGAAHMLEHMAFKGSTRIGTKDYEKEKELLGQFKTASEESKEKILEQIKEVRINNEFSKIYESNGASGLNAATGKDYTYYMVNLPNVSFELWAWMESDRLLNPVFRQFQKEREVVKEERRLRTDDDPNGKLYENLMLTAYEVHPNGYPLIGWAKDLNNLNEEEVTRLHGLYYRPDNMVISLVGDLEISEVKSTLEKYFSRLKRPDSKIPEIKEVEPKQEATRTKEITHNALPRFALAYHKPVFPNPDDMKFTLLHTLLSEGRTSIFYKKLIEGKKIAASVTSSEGPGELYPSVFYVWGIPKVGTSNKVLIKEVEKILESLKTLEFSKQDLDSAKKRMMADLLTTLKSNFGIARALGHAELLWGDWEKLLEMYNITFNTSSEDLNEIAKKYFTDENKTIVTLESKE